MNDDELTPFALFGLLMLGGVFLPMGLLLAITEPMPMLAWAIGGLLLALLLRLFLDWTDR